MFGSSEFSSTFFVKKSQSEAMLMVIEALKQLSMRVVRVDATNGVIVGKVSSSLKSMGEDLTIQMEKKEEGDTLTTFQDKEYPDAEASLMAIANQINSTSNGSGCLAFVIGLFVAIGMFL